MDKQSRNLILIVFVMLLLFGLVLYYMTAVSAKSGAVEGDGKDTAKPADDLQVAPLFHAENDPHIELQKELTDFSSQVLADMKAEQRLNLTMTSQLRTYQDMLGLIDGYAKKVETDVDLIKEISKDEFQEDVRLQASLFSGKKPETVAKHLEEFRSTRVGAILAKMKEKEASQVLDIWAQQKTDESSQFYRQVMDSYLLNKRRDENPALFDKLGKEQMAQASVVTPPPLEQAPPEDGQILPKP